MGSPGLDGSSEHRSKLYGRPWDYIVSRRHKEKIKIRLPTFRQIKLINNWQLGCCAGGRGCWMLLCNLAHAEEILRRYLKGAADMDAAVLGCVLSVELRDESCMQGVHLYACMYHAINFHSYHTYIYNGYTGYMGPLQRRVGVLLLELRCRVVCSFKAQELLWPLNRNTRRSRRSVP